MSTPFLNYDSLDDPGGSPLAGGIAKIMGIILISVSAVTSFMFFAEYASGVFQRISPTLSPYLAGLVGVISFEIMSVVWRYLHANNADTERQMKLAQAGALFSLMGGLLVTVIYFALQTELLAGVIDAQTLTTLQILGGILIILGVSGNFGLYHFYEEASSSHQANLQKSHINAMKSKASFQTRAATTQQTLRHTMSRIDRAIPVQAARQAEIEKDNWEVQSFAPQAGARVKVQAEPANSKKFSENSKRNPHGGSGDNGRSQSPK